METLVVCFPFQGNCLQGIWTLCLIKGLYGASLLRLRHRRMAPPQQMELDVLKGNLEVSSHRVNFYTFEALKLLKEVFWLKDAWFHVPFWHIGSTFAAKTFLWLYGLVDLDFGLWRFVKVRFGEACDFCEISCGFGLLQQRIYGFVFVLLLYELQAKHWSQNPFKFRKLLLPHTKPRKVTCLFGDFITCWPFCSLNGNCGHLKNELDQKLFFQQSQIEMNSNMQNRSKNFVSHLKAICCSTK